MRQHATHPNQGLLTEEAKTYPTWLEVEIGLDAEAIALSWRKRKRIFAERIESGLEALETAAPGIRAKLEAHPARPFAFTGMLTTEEIRAIWDLPELRMLSDRGSKDEPTADAEGRLPFAVEVLQHIQAEGSSIVEVERVTVIVRAHSEEEAKHIAVAECSTMPAHFMGCDYRIRRRWWKSKQAYLNMFYDPERMRHGAAIVVEQWSLPKLKDQPNWRPDGTVERVANGSLKQRPRTWEWIIAKS